MSVPSWQPESDALAKTGYLFGSLAATGGHAMGVSELKSRQMSLGELWSVWSEEKNGLQWRSPFVLPHWLHAWHDTLGRTVEPLILSVTARGCVVGVAPLMMVEGRKAVFLGHPDVCDTFDCAVAPGFEAAFFDALLPHLRALGIDVLELGPVRGDSIVFSTCPAVAEARGVKTSISGAGESFEVDLPGTWEVYLSRLEGKQRHEVRRKLRRLQEAGSIAFRCASRPEDVESAMVDFLHLFKKNRPDKAAFMHEPMEAFFRALARKLANAGLLRLFSLHLRGETVASVFCLDHRSRRYLYNNGYDDRYGMLSVSLLSKILSIRDAVEAGFACYDFLKGSEIYKERLGGRKTPLYQVRLTL